MKRSVLDSKSPGDNTGSRTMFTSSSLSSTIAIILAFLIGILLYILKFKFALKIWIAKTHVKVFNHSLALCLFVSGDKISDRTSKSNLTLLSPIILHRYFSGIGTVICVPVSILLLKEERSYEEKSFQNFPY